MAYQLKYTLHLSLSTTCHYYLKTFVRLYSQSGETADSRAVLVETNKLGHKSLTITNVAGSTLSREADHTLLLHAGPEIAVASTKHILHKLQYYQSLSQIVAKSTVVKQILIY